MNITKEQWQKIGGVIFTALLTICAILGWVFPIAPPATVDVEDLDFIVTSEDPDPGAVSFSAGGKQRNSWLIAKRLTVQGGGTNLQSAVDMDDSLNVDGAATFGSTVAFNGVNTLASLIVTGASDLRGNVSSATGVLTMTDNVLVDGAADVIQLTVQGYTTQTSSLVVFEQSDGTDVLTVSNDGNIVISGTAAITGAVTTISTLDVGSTINYGTDNLYPLGYASASQQIECGVTATFTDTVAVTASALTTATYAVAIQITDPAATAVFLTVDAPAANVFNIDSWESDYTVGTTGITAYWCAIGNQ